MPARLAVTRDQVLAYRRAAGSLDERLPPGPASLAHAARAGLQDSMPRAALLSAHARVSGADPTTWEHPVFAQLWGPRFAAYVVAAADVPVFSLGRLPDDTARRRFAEDMADRLEALLGERTMGYGEAGHALGVNPNMLRYAAPTGRVLLRWDGARGATIRVVPRPALDPRAARLELARRHLRIFGPTTAPSFARWAGIKPPAGRAAFDALAPELVPVHGPIGDGWILAEDEPALRAPASEPGSARLLPSGDAFFLAHGAERELLVPDPVNRDALWTPRVWPGAILVGGELVGTWRRADRLVTLSPWRTLSTTERAAVEAEALDLPIPAVERMDVLWDDRGR